MWQVCCKWQEIHTAKGLVPCLWDDPMRSVGEAKERTNKVFCLYSWIHQDIQLELHARHVRWRWFVVVVVVVVVVPRSMVFKESTFWDPRIWLQPPAGDCKASLMSVTIPLMISKAKGNLNWPQFQLSKLGGLKCIGRRCSTSWLPTDVFFSQPIWHKESFNTGFTLACAQDGHCRSVTELLEECRQRPGEREIKPVTILLFLFDCSHLFVGPASLEKSRLNYTSKPLTRPTAWFPARIFRKKNWCNVFLEIPLAYSAYCSRFKIFPVEINPWGHWIGSRGDLRNTVVASVEVSFDHGAFERTSKGKLGRNGKIRRPFFLRLQSGRFADQNLRIQFHFRICFLPSP